MQQDTHETIEYVDEQDLHAVTGGCNGCPALGSFIRTTANQASAHAKSLAQVAPNTAKAEEERAKKLNQIADKTNESASRPPIPGCNHCDNFAKLTQEVAPLLNISPKLG